MTANASGIVMGIKDGKALIQHEKSKIANRNYYVVGGPGSFKTQSFGKTPARINSSCKIVTKSSKFSGLLLPMLYIL